ncbi:reverse transcriptase domain-containing protein [Tanacetum coccineum]
MCESDSDSESLNKQTAPKQDIIRDMEHTLSTLRKINMKLNQKKCSFGMEEGKFLGYVVTSEGIRANPEKTKAVMDMPSQELLSRCNTLKKCTNKKDFRWIKATEAAFLEMKKLVSELPTLTTPKKGETLMMYLAVADKTVSAMLLTERDGMKMPIHYVTRRLRRYFQAYPIKVITDSPIKQVLSNPEASGRLAKWAIELGAYDIQYVPRVAIKGQMLADFLADTSMETNVAPVRLYTDGASNSGGSGAGLILIASDDVDYSYALLLNFSNSNNDAEYKALMDGLRIATKMQVKDIHAFVDSKLVASQVEGSYKAKGERMIKYQEKVLELAGAFNSLLKHNKQRGNHSDPVLLQEKMGKGVSNTAEVVDEKDSEKEEISLKEYEKVLQEKRKALVSLKSGE